MQDGLRRRFLNEARQLDDATRRLSAFVRPAGVLGDPPTVHRLSLTPFGLLVRRKTSVGHGPPEVWNPAVHGLLSLVLAADPLRHPQAPWVVQVASPEGVSVFNPHVRGEEDDGRTIPRGCVCWCHAPERFQFAAWTAACVLQQVLRILSGEAVHAEGYALQDEAKVWFVEHAPMIFARVPGVVDIPEPAFARAPLEAGSELPFGIEAGDWQPKDGAHAR